MPLNTLRLNHQPSSHPNDRIVFIKPLPRPATEKRDYERAELVLKAIAAQCLPIMKDNHLSVTTLEEHEPNPEFIGRNFNNGEIIQLVIKSKSGAWLPLNMIQMVMMHELAHNTHMNHGRDFWKTRNMYASTMQQLWAKGYTGEGLWGRGQTLNQIQNVLGNTFVGTEELASLPLCGGTFRSRRRKRKAKDGPELTWKEKRDKRIEKNFGKNGVSLGEDEDKRLSLDMKIKGPMGVKPRVAKSKRGRELRAAAALARFSTNKQEVEVPKSADVSQDEETESEDEYEDVDAGLEDAKDVDGQKLIDSKGQTMIRVCGDEDGKDQDAEREMAELADLQHISQDIRSAKHRTDASVSSKEQQVKGEKTNEVPAESTYSTGAASGLIPQNSEFNTDNATSEDNLESQPRRPDTPGLDCPVCSVNNDWIRSTCSICAHVLDPRKDPNAWKCNSDACKDTEYINAGDCGICGVCGSRKPPKQDSGLRNGGQRASAGRSAHIAYL